MIKYVFKSDSKERIEGLHYFAIASAAIITASFGYYTYNEIKESLQIDLKVEQVDTGYSDSKGVFITVEIDNKGLESASLYNLKKTSPLVIYKVEPYKKNKQRIKSVDKYTPEFYKKLYSTSEMQEKNEGHKVVDRRVISSSEKSNLKYYIELEKKKTYYITFTLGPDNLAFSKNPDDFDTNKSDLEPDKKIDYHKFVSKYIVTN